MTTLTVGAGGEYSTLSAAISASHDGDVIQVAAGTYVNDFATINAKITIEGIGGMVQLVANIPPPNGKAILTINADTTIDNLEFSGVAVADGNGAGIRYASGSLVLNDCYFHDNQDGLLAEDNPSGSITINNSEFANNGTGDGFTHNLYVGVIGTLTVDGSYFHDVNTGHEIKSRALNTVIENSRIADGPNGTGSYEIDLPNGGNATVQNNVIEKGPNAGNSNFISFGEEGSVYPNSTLTVNGNTILNDDARPVVLVHDLSGGTVNVTDNKLYGMTPSQTYSGTGTPNQSGNTVLSPEPAFDTSHPFQPAPTVTVCFVAGTRILTSSGEVIVDQLRSGDLVVTLADGVRVLKPVKWIGHRRIDLAVHPRPLLVSPIRILRGAIAENVPHRDLLLSPDHALYLDGVLIVARQLINGSTIRQETVKSVRYFHVELDAHAILLAEGMAAESYLDTGNRGFFSNAASPLILHPGLEGDARVAGSRAPFHDDEATVRPIWRRLAERATRLGFERESDPTSTDPELRLSVNGHTARAVSVTGGCHAFVLPAGATEARLLSRAALPTDCRPWLDDRRLLGIPVGRIVLCGGATVEEIPLDHPALRDGWWDVEHWPVAASRWTNGDALLSLPRQPGPTVLEIHLTGEMLYPQVMRRRA
jgi:hypothetical protein